MCPGDPRPCVPQALLSYYCQEGYFHHLRAAAEEALGRLGGHPVFHFYRAYGDLRTGNTGREEEAGLCFLRPASHGKVRFLGYCMETIQRQRGLNALRDEEITCT